MIFHKHLILTSILLIGIILVGCVPAGADVIEEPTAPTAVNGSSAVGAEIAIFTGYFPQEIDPTLATLNNPAGMDLIGNVATRLTRFDPSNGGALPLLADDWHVSGDGLVWTFSLKDNWDWVVVDVQGEIVPFDPISSEDVVFTFKRLCSLTEPADLPDALKNIDGCMEMALNPQNPTEEFGVRTSGSDVSFELKRQTGDFPVLLSMPVFSILPEQLLTDRPEDWHQPQAFWSSGPFVISPNSDLSGITTFLKNPFYPLDDETVVDRITHRGDLSREDALALWEEGGLDVMLLSGSDGESMREGAAVQTCAITTFAAFLYDNAPFSLAGIREGFARAIDQDALVDPSLTGAFGDCQIAIPAVALSPYDHSARGWPYQPDEALAAMNDYGYYACSSIYPQAVSVDSASPAASELASRVFSQLQTNIECRDTTLVLEPETLFDLTAEVQTIPGYYDAPRSGMSFITWVGESISQDHWSAGIYGCREYFPEAFLNQNKACSESDMLLADAARATDPAERTALYQQAYDDFFAPDGEFPVIPLVYWARGFAHHGAMASSNLDGLFLPFNQFTLGGEG